MDCHRGGDTQHALEIYQKVLVRDPENACALHFLALIEHRSGRSASAVELLRRCVRNAPHAAEFYNNLAEALKATGDLESAIECYRKALEIQPDYVIGYNNLGAALVKRGWIDEAIALYEKATRLFPDKPEPHWNLGLALLLNGDFANGWKEYEWRWRCKDFPSPRRDFPQPQWDGSDLTGRTLLLHAEQGLGDAIQFLRYVPMAAERCGGRVVLEVPACLKGLARTVGGASLLVETGTALPQFDAHLPLMSLPLIFGTTERTIPAEVPYLFVDPRRVAAWSARLATDRRLRIGLAWAGSPKHNNDRNRSCPLAALSRLAGVFGVSWHSLQKGDAADRCSAAPEGMNLIDHSNDLNDFADTAALIANLDLVISVDTSVAHLAGAIGKPVWIMLPAAPDWRWMLARGDSPWYPSARLFRQAAAGEWASVDAAAAEALGNLLSERRRKRVRRGSVLAPFVPHPGQVGRKGKREPRPSGRGYHHSQLSPEGSATPERP